LTPTQRSDVLPYCRTAAAHVHILLLLLFCALLLFSRLRCHPDTDPESFLSSHSIVQAIEAADEFFSACSSDVSDDNETFYDVSPPMSLSLAPDWGSHSSFEWSM
jgi:hypothetical protein